MYKADLNHPDKTLQTKLEQLYTLSRGHALDLSFRPPYLRLLEKFGNPHLGLPPTIHVAGTNGKGSTIAIMRAILEASGYKVHVYTSPHLLRFNERIVLAGEMISDEALETLIDEALTLNDSAEITFFEITTAMAFAAFSREPADILLLEVGLGGRLDCTNIILKPDVSVINVISYDHTQFLGSSLAQISREKAGIIKESIPCVIAQQPELSDVLSGKTAVDIVVEEARDKNAPLYRAGHEWVTDPHENSFIFRFGAVLYDLPAPNLTGAHQIANAGTALAALHLMQGITPVTPEAMAKGLRHVYWPARLEKLDPQPFRNTGLTEEWELWYDGGHNDSAGLALAAQAAAWTEGGDKDLHIILGMKADKDPQAFLTPLLPFARSLTVTHVNDIGPCITADQVGSFTQHLALHFFGQHNDLASAIRNITSVYPDQGGRILICGSLYLAEKIEAMKS